MLNRKRLREKGIVRLGHIFKKIKPGDKVLLIRNLSFKANYPKRLHGRTAVVVGKQGKAYIVRFLNGKTYRNLIVNAVHLRKLEG